MGWYREFISQDYGSAVYKHKNLPLYVTKQFKFYRCVEFKESFYGMTASEFFSGNLRYPHKNDRYSSIFPGQKLSYWADSPSTARAEIKKHGAGNDIVTFWAYDDATSTFPTTLDGEPLLIVDVRRHGLQGMFDRLDSGESASSEDIKKLAEIMSYAPDCLVYDAHARKGGENFLFFEKGFKKLALRELRLRFGREHGGNHNRIACAVSSDYSPVLEGYGYCFMPKARTGFVNTYLQNEEYRMRKEILEKRKNV